MSANLKLKVQANPARILEPVRRAVYDAYVEELEKARQELERESPVGATGELKNGWSISYPRRDAWTFRISANIKNDAPNALNRIVGRGAGKQPPVDPLTDWVQAKGIEADPIKARRIAFAIGRVIAQRGTRRWREADNFVGLSRDGNIKPDGYLAQLEEKIARKIQFIKLSQ